VAGGSTGPQGHFIGTPDASNPGARSGLGC